MTHSRILITEGIGDYYAFELMKQGRQVSILPSVGADSVKFYISLLMITDVTKECTEVTENTFLNTIAAKLALSRGWWPALSPARTNPGV